MDDLDYLLLIVALFYLYECAYWVRPGSMVFVSFLGGRHRPHTLGERALIRNDWGGLLFGNLLPIGTSVQTQFWPVSLSPEGVFGWVAQAITPEGRPEQSERFYLYDDIRTVTVDGSVVRINDERFVTVCSSDLAHSLAARIEKLAALPADRREREIDSALANAFNAAEADSRFRAARWHTLILMLLCTLFLLFVFAFIPVSIARGWKLELSQYLISYFGLLSLVMIQFFTIHSDLLPGAAASRRKHTLMMLISPANAMHARNDLFRDVLSQFHPLAVARDRCDRDDFRRFARHCLLDLRHPLTPVCPSSDPAACTTESWFREKLLAAVLRLVRGAGLDADQLAAPPKPETSECRTYCPRCDGQFILEHGECHCCNGMPLCRFDGPLPPPFPPPPPEPIVETPVAAKEPEPASVQVQPAPTAITAEPVQAGSRKKEKRRRGKRRR